MGLRCESSNLEPYLQRLRYSPAYLRQAPPLQYYSLGLSEAPSGGEAAACRHRIQLLDDAVMYRGTSKAFDLPPHTSGTYLVSSTGAENVAFTPTTEEPRQQVHSTLIGLPDAPSEAHLLRFIEAHREVLRTVHAICLPDVPLTARRVLNSFRRSDVMPRLQCMWCGDFGKAFVENDHFYHAVVRAAVDSAGTAKESIEGWGGDESAVDSLVQAVPLGGTTFEGAAPDSPRPLQARPIVLPVEGAAGQREANRYPSHYTQHPVFFYDAVFHAIFVGSAVFRCPWVSAALQPSHSSFAFPMPLSTHIRHHRSDRPPTRSYFHPLTSAAVLREGLLHSFPLKGSQGDQATAWPQRVLSSKFGELPGDVLSVVEGVETGSERLVRLWGRLREANQAGTCTALPTTVEMLLREMQAEEPSEGETNQGECFATIASWASSSSSPMKCLCECMQETSASRIPLPAAKEEPHTAESGSPSPDSAVDLSLPQEFSGAKGTALLKRVFAMKGLGGLERVLQREEIDVDVFLAMTQEELQTVFKPTFGLRKKLESVQKEVQQKVKNLLPSGKPSLPVEHQSKRAPHARSSPSRTTPSAPIEGKPRRSPVPSHRRNVTSV